MLPAYFYPESVASSYLGDNLRESLCNDNITIELYTSIPSRNISQEVYLIYKKKKKEFLLNDKLIVHRFKLIKESKNPIKRAIRYFICCNIQLYKAIKSKDINVIFLASTPPIQGAMGAVIKKIKHIPFVYNLQDIFPDSLVGTGMTHKGSLLWKIGRKIENFTYRNADKIIVISEDFKKNIMAKGVPEKKIEVIYNWVDEQAVKDIPREKNDLFDKYNLDRNKFYLTYSGNIGLTQNMDMLLEVAKALDIQPNIHFVLIGDGAYRKRVEEIIEHDNIKNVSLLPFQPYKEISKVFSLGDAGLVISKPGVGANSVPSKTWSILSASRPVLANFDENELKDIIENNQCGIFTKAGDKVFFKNAIIELYEHKDKCIQYGKNGRNFILNNLTKQIGTQKYVDIIKQFDK